MRGLTSMQPAHGVPTCTHHRIRGQSVPPSSRSRSKSSIRQLATVQESQASTSGREQLISRDAGEYNGILQIASRSNSRSTTSCRFRLQEVVLPAVVMHQIWMSLHAPAQAAEALPATAVGLFREFLDQIQALGPWGGALFVLTVMSAEMVPLFPTQPLSLASGLLFGPVNGALYVVVGVTLAAINAFSLSRGVGRPLAEKVIAAEVGKEDAGVIARQLAAVNQAIESGGFAQQVTAITLLRLTPVVPFSASNYLLGLTPVQLAPMVLGTVAGMSVWSVLYASLGAASRALLDGGVELDVLMADLTEKAAQYSEDVAVCGLLLGVVAGCYYLVAQRLQGSDDQSGSQQPPHSSSLDSSTSQREEVLQNK